MTTAAATKCPSRRPPAVGLKERMHRAWAKVRRETGYRSGYEKDVAEALSEAVPSAQYEAAVLRYEVHAWRRYLPDFLLPEQAIVIEAKGQLTTEDRAKMLLLKRQFPTLDIRILLQNPKDKLTPRMTAGDWCEKTGFPFAKGPNIPEAWVCHSPSSAGRAAFDACFPTLAPQGDDKTVRRRRR